MWSSQPGLFTGKVRDRIQDLMKEHKISHAESAIRIGSMEKHSEPVHHIPPLPSEFHDQPAFAQTGDADALVPVGCLRTLYPGDLHELVKIFRPLAQNHLLTSLVIMDLSRVCQSFTIPELLSSLPWAYRDFTQ